MNNVITIRAVEGFTEYNHNETEVTGKVSKGEEFVAWLDDKSQEYLTEDSEYREVYVGKLDNEGKLTLDEYFELIQEGISLPFKDSYLFHALASMGNASGHMAWANTCVRDVADIPEEMKKRMKNINKQIHELQEEIRTIKSSLNQSEVK